MGLDPAHYWCLTPREIAAIVAGAGQRLEREHNERAWLAYHAGLLGRMKRPPPLRALQSRPHRRRGPPQTWQQQKAIAEMWVSAMAGLNGGQPKT